MKKKELLEKIDSQTKAYLKLRHEKAELSADINNLEMDNMTLTEELEKAEAKVKELEHEVDKELKLRFAYEGLLSIALRS